CGICNTSHTNCFCSAVETIAGIILPPRAKYLRMVVTELNRIHSHFLLIGVAGFELGFETFFQYSLRDREIVLNLIEMVTGNRVMSEFNTFGGVRRDLTPETIAKGIKELHKLQKRMKFYKEFLETDATFRMRTKGVGILKKKDALRLCVVGPVARASGIPIDIRKNDPCTAHEDLPFDMIVYKEGDSLARFQLRVDEIIESIRIITEALTHLPDGPYRVRVPRRIPEGEDVARIEAPRGELIYYVKSSGGIYPERVKVRSPTQAVLNCFKPVVKGSYIADIPAILISMDPCFSCGDRMGFIDINTQKHWVRSTQDIIKTWRRGRK
ncbi:MAG: hydrogenase large subunit, partial [Candidatus Ranarchaeia archaeon]